MVPVFLGDVQNIQQHSGADPGLPETVPLPGIATQTPGQDIQDGKGEALRKLRAAALYPTTWNRVSTSASHPNGLRHGGCQPQRQCLPHGEPSQLSGHEGG